MSILDHAVFLIAAIVFPLVSFFSFRRLLQRIASGEKVDRKTLYNSTALSLWLLFVVTMIAWALSGRPWTVLGFDLRVDSLFFLAAALVVAGSLFFVLQIRRLPSLDADELARLRASAGDVDIILPRNGNELARFYGVSLTAGIVEETVWRGYFIWYLSMFMPVWAAAVISTIGFGIAHAYQGWANVPKITLVGAAFALLFLMSGSLWLPMIFHAIVDIAQGRLAYEVVNRTDLQNPSADDESAVASA